MSIVHLSTRFVRTAGFIAAVASLSLAACADGIGDGDIDTVAIGSEKALSAEGSDTVDVENDLGGIAIVGESGRDEYLIRPTADSAADEALFDDVTIIAKIEGSALKVEISGPSELIGLIDVEVLAPSANELAIINVDEDIVINGMEGTGAIATQDGSITINDFAGGELAINSTGGSVSVGMDDSSNSDIAINTGSGDISISVGSNPNFELTANTGGDVNVNASGFETDVPGVPGIPGVDGIAVGTFGAGDGTVVVNSGSGDITIDD